MGKIEVFVRFVTPAFLGDSTQKGTWRTPPFKALLRRWWRIARSRHYDYCYSTLREDEGRLFGHAWLKGPGKKQWALKSRVKISLEEWRRGRGENVSLVSSNLGKLKHPETTRPVDPLLYLGYGPLGSDRQAGRRVSRMPYIQGGTDGEKVKLWLKGDVGSIPEVLRLIHCFGTIGGRSRNGWGSIELEEAGSKIELPDLDDFADPKNESARNWIRDGYSAHWLRCLNRDWPHAIGKDDSSRLLIWRTKKEYDHWYEAMRELAEIKVAFRTSLPVSMSRRSQALPERLVISYPVTNHVFSPWGKKKRYPNQLVFKVIRVKEQTRFVGIVFHLPHGLPEELSTSITNHSIEAKVWNKVHNILDKCMERLP